MFVDMGNGNDMRDATLDFNFMTINFMTRSSKKFENRIHKFCGQNIYERARMGKTFISTL